MAKTEEGKTVLNPVVRERLKRLLLWTAFVLGVFFLFGYVLPALVAGARLAGFVKSG